MPEITLLGWLHTLIAIIALVAGVFTLAKHKLILPENRSAQIYLICTFIAATTALMIYQHGGFGPAHGLAVLTLLALLFGWLVTKLAILEGVKDYLQALGFSSTLLFHMIPAITDGLLRLPVGAPILTDPHDPLLRQFYLLFLVLFVIGYIAQCLWIKKHR